MTMERDGKHSGALTLCIAGLLLILIVCLLSIYYLMFLRPPYNWYNERQYQKYLEETAGAEPAVMSADELAEELWSGGETPKLDDLPGELEIIGVVDEVDGDGVLHLDNGIDCYVIPEVLSPLEQSKAQYMLRTLGTGDVVGITGMPCGVGDDFFAMKYCGVPYLYHDGMAYYTDYETNRRTGSYPDVAYSDEDYALLQSGAEPMYYQAPEVLGMFLDQDGLATDASWQYGVSIFQNQVIYVSGTVTEVYATYIVIEEIYCYFEIQILTETEITAIQEVRVGDYVTVCGLVSNPSYDAFRMKYCTVTEREPGAADAADGEEGEVPQAIQAVLNRETDFINRGFAPQGDMGPSEMRDPQSLDAVDDGRGSQPYEMIDYSVIDFDQDGVNEVLAECSNQFEDIYLVLREYEGEVYGYMVVYSGLTTNVYPNGSFSASAGVNHFYVNYLVFQGDACRQEEELYYDIGIFSETYEINNESVTREECETYIHENGYDALLQE